MLKNIYFFSIFECFQNKRFQPDSRNLDIPRVCTDAHIVETCIKEKHTNCMEFYHRQFPMFIAHEVIRRPTSGRNAQEEGIPECLKKYFSPYENDDDEFPTLKKLDDELNKLLKKN